MEQGLKGKAGEVAVAGLVALVDRETGAGGKGALLDSSERAGSQGGGQSCKYHFRNFPGLIVSWKSVQCSL